jgi:hypothetical protein
MSSQFTGTWRARADKIIGRYGNVMKGQPRGSRLRESLLWSCFFDLEHLRTNMLMAQGKLKFIPITVLPRSGPLNYPSQG